MEKKKYAVSNQTRQAMANALKELMAQKPIDKITIRDITDLCDMRRQNFYYHFQDIYDLMHWMFQQEAVSLLEKYEGALLCQEGLLEVFRYLQANRAVCLCALHSVGHENMKRLFQEKIYAVIHRTVEQIAKESGCTTPGITGDDTDLMTTVYSLTLTGVAESWLLGEIRETPEELVAFINQMLQDHVRGARMRESEDSHFPESKDTLPEFRTDVPDASFSPDVRSSRHSSPSGHPTQRSSPSLLQREISSHPGDPYHESRSLPHSHPHAAIEHP